MIASFFKFLFGTKNQRAINKLKPLVEKINSLEENFINLEDSQFIIKTVEFRERVSKGESLDSILPEAYALVREASKRKLGQRHYDVQLIGGIVLHQGKISEMKTGEGKTLTSTLPLYLNSLSGEGVHLVTVNDYLANRDAEWMSPIYNALGVTVSALKENMNDFERKKVYSSDIVYGTNSQFGFDYLRDNMKFRISDYVQRSLNFAIVDEADSVLIDEARTPLIISGSSNEDTIELYKSVDKIIKNFRKKEDYEIDEKEKNVTLTEEGVDKIESCLQIKNLYAPENIKVLHHVMQSLKAHAIFKKDVDYIVYDGRVLIVDEFTGRILDGRRYNDGLHQAIEAKEGVEIEEESQTLASITLQNYFRLYKKISGMTGTAFTEAEEFHKIYNLDVVVIPTNRDIRRMDKNDLIFLSENSKFKNILKDVSERYEKGQPVLIGTVAVETSEKLSAALSKAGIPHEVLNAKNHARESEIIANAGKKGKITIATNMAGRGTDIKLTEESKELGGLYILGTERHESRRIDNQLRGRSGRQGDPGESRFYISLDDSLIRRFSGEKLKTWMIKFGGMKEDEIIEDQSISSMIETAQEKVEKHNFEIRKQLIEYDDVLNQQRIIIYKLRKMVISGGESLKSVFSDLLEKFLKNLVFEIVKNKKNTTSEEKREIIGYLTKNIEIDSNEIQENILAIKSAEQIISVCHEILYSDYLKNFENLLNDQSENDNENDKNELIILEKQKWFMLETIDQAWRQHIVNLENIKEGIGLRGYGQKTPIIEYKSEAFNLFKEMMKDLFETIITNILKKDFNKTEDIENIRKHISKLENEFSDMLMSHLDSEEMDEKKIRETLKILEKKGIKMDKKSMKASLKNSENLK